MIRDPLYRSIVERLNAPLDEESFERSAQAMLRPLYPTLVPIRGGGDGGMDGVTADIDRKQIVLVATTSERVKRNLEESLGSMLKDKNPCRRIISATSRKLTPDKQKELREAAKGLGFRLVQIHEQAAFADLLYENSRWRKELLGLTGAPPPLSAIPRSTRPRLTSELVGHELDAKWLIETKGDRLLIGQPGSGKSFLLSSLASKHGWLFVVSKDPESLANGIREQKPSALIVDDAHNDPSFLQALSQLRADIGADFPIIATSWPGAQAQIAESLLATDSRIRKLSRLSRPEIATILEAAGLPRENERLVFEILNQAEGQPGLAITLAHLCLLGNEVDLERVVFGEALLSSIRNVLEQLVGPSSIPILAALSVGGGPGMRMQTVANYLAKPASDIRHVVTGLSAGGVIHDVDGQHLSVRPEELRYALIRDTFFSGASSLDIFPLLEHVPSLSATAETLVLARHYGAEVPPEMLKLLLLHSDSTVALNAYAWLGPDETKWVIEKHPEEALSLVYPALANAPEIIIPLLLRRAVGDNRPLHSHTDHPLRKLEDWIKEGVPGSGEAVSRRESLMTAALSWLRAGEDQDTGIHAASIALTPEFRAHSTDPVLGNTVTIRMGVIGQEEIDELARLWEALLEYLESFGSSRWKYVLEVLSDWVYPQRHSKVALPEDYISKMRSVAAAALQRIVKCGSSNPGLLHAAAALATELEIDFVPEGNPEFEALFPRIVGDATEWKKQEKAIRDLASRWAPDKPANIVRQILQLEEQARSVNEQNCCSPLLMHEIAGQVSSPLDWVSALITEGARGDLIAPFLQRAAHLNSPGWEEAALSCLAGESTRAHAVSLALTLPEPPTKLLEQALLSLHGLSKMVEHLACRKAIPESTLRKLLAHSDDEIASRIALGIWVSDRTASIPTSLADDWRAAVLRSSREEYWFGELVKVQPDIAFDWLRNEIQRNDRHWSRHYPGQKEALAAISVDQRFTLLSELPDSFWSRDVAAWLIRDHVELMEELLGMDRLKHLHLAPLRGYPNETNWTDKAKAAITAGYPPNEIAGAAFRGLPGWRGKESEMYSIWIDRFSSLSSHEGEDIRRIGVEGLKMATADRDEALKRERSEETYGRR